MEPSNVDFKFEGIGFNGPHLAKMAYPDFKKEVAHNFPGPDGEAKMQTLHAELLKKWPQAPVSKPAEIAPAATAGATDKK